jgi:GAF domain-containing protein
MKVAPIIENETIRLQELYAYDVLDTNAEQGIDEIAQMAAIICQAPIALVSLADARRQWFKAKVGILINETPRDISFCGHAIAHKDVFIIPDADVDSRFFDNPLVTGLPWVKFYAAAPLKTPAGLGIGTLCVIDHRPRYLTHEQTQILIKLSNQVMDQFELRRLRLCTSKI